jgi:2-methylcitrate dehydratase
VSGPDSNVRPKLDKVLTLIADYATKVSDQEPEAYETARYCLRIDTPGCGLRRSRPGVHQAARPDRSGDRDAARRQGAAPKFQLDQRGAFNIGAMIRWLDFNDSGPGSPLNGATRRTTWAAFSRPRIGFQEIPRHCSCGMS